MLLLQDVHAISSQEIRNICFRNQQLRKEKCAEIGFREKEG
jgi:hypothetical protein